VRLNSIKDLLKKNGGVQVEGNLEEGRGTSSLVKKGLFLRKKRRRQADNSPMFVVLSGVTKVHKK